MKTTIFIPNKIKCGFQKRSDTYTGQLAYVIYYDQKGVLRKEKSWESWRNKDIEPKEFDNVPTNGFVLNKKVGDYSGSWGEHRQAYTRIYDPRDFEFEITINNLLWILENNNAYKGKGLDGEYCYGWDGELLLVPASSPDYIEISSFSSMINKPESIKGKDLILGGTYRTNKNEDWIYLGRFDKYENYSWHKQYRESLGLHYYFQHNNGYETLKSLSNRIVKTISAEPVSNYAELMEELEHHDLYSPLDESKDEYIPCTQEEIYQLMNKDNWNWSRDTKFFCLNGKMISVTLRRNDNKYHIENDWNYWNTDSYGHGYRSYERNPEKEEMYRIANETYKNPMALDEFCSKFTFYKRNQYLKNGKLKH